MPGNRTCVLDRAVVGVRSARSVGLMTNADPNRDTEAREETLGSTVPERDAAADTSLQRDPDDWVTGDEPMTAAQKSYLDTLAREAGEELPATLSKAEASEHIERLQKGNPRRG